VYKRQKQRRERFLSTASRRFKPDYLKLELKDPDCSRPVYTLYTPLRGKCILGDAAAILESEDPDEITAVLNGVEDLHELPSSALVHALQTGVCFPLPDRMMNIEEMDMLAARLAENKEELLELTRRVDKASNLQSLTWVRGLFLTAVKVCDWKVEAEGMELARRFAAVEKKFLPLCYTPELLCSENLFVLPPMHRFGWYCAQAFDALDGGNTVDYVRLLRKGLDMAKDMKPMVEFLTEHTPQLQAAKPSGELLELAEKVRTMLLAYPPNDPAVAMLKQSAAYLKVAHLIEGPELLPIGGLAQ